MKATQQLKDEHEGVKIMLSILEQVCQQLEAKGSLNKEHFEGILEFLKVFVDKCHHGKEEDLLFPALVAVGVPKEGPIATVLHEHELGRNHVKAMSKAFAAFITGDKSSSQDIMQNAHGYISLLKDHIEMENNVLFVVADNRLSEKSRMNYLKGLRKSKRNELESASMKNFTDCLRN